MGIMNADEFEPRTVDKVERLLDLLDEMERHPALKGRLALHGGTATNLFMLDVPRLSVDIDVSCIGSVSREDMLADRPRIEAGIEAVAQALGYAVEAHPGGHAGRTFLLRYRGDWGVDHVKVDCIYMNRSPILPPIVRETPVRPDAKVRTFADAELAAGKVKAFFDRVKVRDLYDISNLRGVYKSLEPDEQESAHQLALYYASLSACFPKPFEGREQRFTDRLSELADQLYPMLRSSTERPTLDALMKDAERFIAEWVLPRTDGEREYLERLAGGDYRPELVFPDKSMAQAAAVNPEALWKVENLRKMHR
ncbi:putative nucleotidyltransferase component of viral defense system [Olsenella profusa DSM 13989]|uniref:nucleotidyl transferase AbiEii/AbiGii toxin family protein n=1 Tax=Olsenella profusa TaxID=138595 RepID=UPI002783788F|nr:nucleotidyl transferase AbiEii/AbiGii toxin family protein [Olsenella profusa]MDP9860683.1 putative nucleotidyltransferase component of viral defense system [Olsenella profusa DSM 13989]